MWVPSGGWPPSLRPLLLNAEGDVKEEEEGKKEEEEEEVTGREGEEEDSCFVFKRGL